MPTPDEVARLAEELEAAERGTVEDGAGFDPSLVPDGPLGELLRDGRTGRGISDAEYDVMIARMRAHGADPFHD